MDKFLKNALRTVDEIEGRSKYDVSFKLRFADTSGLCGTCRHALISTYDDGTKDVFCGSYQRNEGVYAKITKLVVKCSKYSDATRPSIESYEKLAWVIVTDEKRKIGFKPLRDLSKDERRKHTDYEDPFEED